MLKTNKQTITAVSHCVASENSRYALNNILATVRDGYATYVATDGKQLFTHKTNGQDIPTKPQRRFGFTTQVPDYDHVETMQLSADVCKMVKKCKKHETATIEFNGDELRPRTTVKTWSGEFTSTDDTGRFPRIEDVKRDFEEMDGPEITLSVDVLLKTLKAFDALDVQTFKLRLHNNCQRTNSWRLKLTAIDSHTESVLLSCAK